MFARKEYHVLRTRIAEPRRFIQVVVGPRQVGKSTMVKQVLETINVPFHQATADNVPASNPQWISEMWDVARSNMRYGRHDEYLLVIDEIQKVKGWSEVVKKEWDNDTFNSLNLKVVLLGSSRVLLEKGLSDSLAGRFEEIRMSHWNWPEMKEAFGVSFVDYITKKTWKNCCHRSKKQLREFNKGSQQFHRTLFSIQGCYCRPRRNAG